MAQENLQIAGDTCGDSWLDAIGGALKDLRFGSVEIVVHDGKIVQVERREKWRCNRELAASLGVKR
ncbi:MAG: DUF2292 domain-containing protein [Methylococcaceae bacterium]|nr:DUF2292 domain-containing protein [Methylococcaceae bacterium]